jgi:hypothetical protein
MPYDYPGEYSMRFDGVEVARFRKLVVVRRTGRSILDASRPGPAGPGTLTVHDVAGAGLTGDVLIHRWQRSGLPSVKRPNVTIEALSGAAAGTRWRLRNAQPVKRVMKPHLATAKGGSGNEVAIETLEIAHEGMIEVD